MKSNIVIVYHSGYVHTSKIAEAVATGSGGRLLAIDAEGYLSSFAGLATASPSDASVDEIPAGDLATARAFGEPIGQASVRLLN